VDALNTLINFELMAHQRQVVFSGNAISAKHKKEFAAGSGLWSPRLRPFLVRGQVQLPLKR
jgi:hypothetical protein